MTSSPKKTAADRRAAARQRAEELRRQEAARKRRNTLFGVLAGVLVVALVVVAVVIATRGGKGDDGGAAAPASTKVDATTHLTADYGTPVGKGGHAGTENAGAPVISIYFDYSCSHCADLERKHEKELDALVNEGKATVVYHPVAILQNAWSTYGAAADFYIIKNAPEQYTAFHNAMFAVTDELLNQKRATIPTPAEIADIAKKAGVPESVTKGLAAEISSQAATDFLNKVNQHFRDAGYRGTPTVLINGKENDEWFTKGFAALVEKGK